MRIRAPELVGRGGWLNTGGKSYALAELRGKIVLLDFWTFACINCLHVIDELKPIEKEFADVLVVVGVHSPKFVHEADHAAVVAAVERYEVHHPVLDDPDMTTWDAFAVRAWPTLVVIDPEGYVVAQASGEGHAHGLRTFITALAAEHETKGTLHRGSGPYVAPEPQPSTLRFPAKVIRLPSGHLLVADAGHHALTELDGETLVRRIGDGQPGLVDGNAPRFHEPGGLCLLPPEVAQVVSYDVVVADTVNHALRGVRLSDGYVTTVAGTGAQWMQNDGFPTETSYPFPLSSPWDVAWVPARDEVVVAMAGIHQLWGFDPRSRVLRVVAGTTNEGLRDGPPEESWLAQPSGLAADGERLWFVDAETSSLRSLANGVIATHVGTGLFDFGLMDGPAEDAMFQHPLGVTLLPDGSVAVLDTYNGAVRRFDPATRLVTTLVTGLREPSGAVIDDDGTLLVVESAAHRVTRISLPREALQVDGERHRTQRPPLEVGAGKFEINVVFEPPAGEHLDERYGPATRLLVSSTPSELLVDGSGSGTALERTVVFAEHVLDGVLHVAAFAASCDEGGEVEFPACHVHQQDWGIPVTVAPNGISTLTLYLRG
jgi:thiol-disulfide isomerase/thioredoxin